MTFYDHIYESPEVTRLRKQKERIVKERRDSLWRKTQEAEATRLRKEIRDLGEEPCA